MSFETTLPRLSQVHLTPGLVVHFKDLLKKRGRLQRLGWSKKCTVSLHAADASKKVGRLLMHEFFIWLLHTRGSWICSDCIHQTIASLMYSALHVIHINVHFLLVTSHISHVIISTVTLPLAPTKKNTFKQRIRWGSSFFLAQNVEMAKFPSTFTLHSSSF